MSMSVKLSIPIICVNIILIFVIGYTSNLLVQEKFTTEYTETIQELSAIIKEEIDDLQNSAEDNCKWFQYSARIISAVENNDALMISELSDSATASFDFDLFMIMNKEGNVLFNNCYPEMAGLDYADEFVPFKTAINGEVYSDIYINENKAYACATSPVFDDSGKPIATITLGYDLTSESFVDDHQKLIDHEVTMFIGITRAMTTLTNEKNERIIGTDLTDPHLIDEVTNKHNLYIGKTVIQGKNYLCGYTPIVNKNGEQMILFLGKNRTIVEEIGASISEMLRIVVAMFAVGSIVIILLFIFMLINRPMKKFINTMNNIKSPDSKYCDLTLRIENKSKDEIGRIGKQFNSLLDEIEGIVSQIKDVSDTLALSSETLAASSEETTAMTANVTTAMNHIFEAVHGQNEEVQSSVSQMDILSENMDNIVENTNEMESSSNETEVLTQSGLKTVNLLKDKSEKSSMTISEMSKYVTSLNQKSQEIDTILTAITNISVQTNMLSLNASIEASRAGEAGRGFAVVAGEVGALAIQSSDSTKEIQVLITDIKKDIDTITNLMKQVNEINAEQTSAVDNTGKSFSDIHGAVERITDSIGVVSNAIVVMGGNKEQISSSIGSISESSDETLQSTDSANTSVSGISDAVESISELAQELNAISVDLNAKIEVFKVRD